MGRRKKRNRERQVNERINTSYVNQRSRQIEQYEWFRHLKREKEKHEQKIYMAKSKVSNLFPGRLVLIKFDRIKLEILHLIPIYPHLAPELIFLKTVEENSILLGQIVRYSPYQEKAYIKDINGAEICLSLVSCTDVVRPGRFVAIKNPQLTIFEDGEFGFRAADNTDVHFIDVDDEHLTFLDLFIVAVLVLVVCLGVYFK